MFVSCMRKHAEGRLASAANTENDVVSIERSLGNEVGAPLKAMYYSFYVVYLNCISSLHSSFKLFKNTFPPAYSKYL